MKRFVATGVLAANAVAMAVGVAAASPAHADSDSDFLRSVHMIEADSDFSWLKVRSDSSWIIVGKAVCSDLDRGQSLAGSVNNLAMDSRTGFTPQLANWFVNAAVKSYCPVHAGG
jgi:hypothetical protein